VVEVGGFDQFTIPIKNFFTKQQSHNSPERKSKNIATVDITLKNIKINIGSRL
jgi:hypothetical protein